MKYLLFAIVCVIFLNGCGPCPNCGCDNVDDCLSKYKFEEARKHASYWNQFFGGEVTRYDKPNVFFKIITQEVNYWISQNELVKAKNILKEMPGLEVTFELETVRDKRYFELNFDIIRRYCQKQQYDEALSLIMELPEKFQFVNEVMINGGNGSKKIEKCRKIYNSYKKELKQNQEIEPFKESSADYYKITSNEYIRKEALKIIEEYKIESKK